MARNWDKVSMHVFENIYLPAAQSGNPSTVYIDHSLSLEKTSSIRMYQRLSCYRHVQHHCRYQIETLGGATTAGA